MGHQPELSGGQLPRSSGIWSQVLSQRSKGGDEQFDQRILGGSEFIQAILQEADQRQQRQLRVRQTHRSLADLVEEQCRKRRISVNEMRHGSRRSAVSRARAEIAHRCKEEVGVSAAEIARHLGVNTSSITRAIERIER
jgi:chromosomal replication initiation ATPase DnaA